MSNLYQIMRQLKSDKSQASSVGETVQSPDKSSSDVTPTINHRARKTADGALTESIPAQEGSSPEDDDPIDAMEDIKAFTHHRAENTLGKLSSFLNREVGSLSRDIVVQGDTGSVVSELTYDHALRPVSHHQVLSALAARQRIQEEVASCESGETSFTPLTRGNATVSEENSTDLYYHNSFQMSMSEDLLPPLHDRAHDTDDASVSGLHQPPITPSPHASLRELQHSSKGNINWHPAMDSADGSLQYSEQDSALNFEVSSTDDQSYSLFSVSTPGYSVKSRSFHPPRVATVTEEVSQHDDSVNLEQDMGNTASNAEAPRGHVSSRPYGTDESVDLSEKDVIQYSGGTYVSSTTGSYISASYVSTSTAAFSVLSGKHPSTSALNSCTSEDTSVGGESKETNKTSNTAIDDSVGLPVVSSEEKYSEADNDTLIQPQTHTQAKSLAQSDKIESTPLDNLTTAGQANFSLPSMSSKPDGISHSVETTLLVDLDTLNKPGEVPETFVTTDCNNTQECSGDVVPPPPFIDSTFSSTVAKPTCTDNLVTASNAGCEDRNETTDDSRHIVSVPGDSIERALMQNEGNNVAVGETTLKPVAPVEPTSEAMESPLEAAEQRAKQGVRFSPPTEHQSLELTIQEISVVENVKPIGSCHKQDSQRNEKQKASKLCCKWKWTFVFLGLALGLAILAVPAVIIPLVIMHSRGSNRKLRHQSAEVRERHSDNLVTTETTRSGLRGKIRVYARKPNRRLLSKA